MAHKVLLRTHQCQFFSHPDVTISPYISSLRSWVHTQLSIHWKSLNIVVRVWSSWNLDEGKVCEFWVWMYPDNVSSTMPNPRICPFLNCVTFRCLVWFCGSCSSFDFPAGKQFSWDSIFDSSKWHRSPSAYDSKISSANCFKGFVSTLSDNLTILNVGVNHALSPLAYFSLTGAVFDWIIFLLLGDLIPGAQHSLRHNEIGLLLHLIPKCPLQNASRNLFLSLSFFPSFSLSGPKVGWSQRRKNTEKRRAVMLWCGC